MVPVTLYSEVEIRHPDPHGIWPYAACIRFEVSGTVIVGHPCNNQSHPFHLRPQSEAVIVKHSQTKKLSLPAELEEAAMQFVISLTQCKSLLKPAAIGGQQREKAAIDAKFASWFMSVAQLG